jgi:hypothetical protein
VVVADHEPPLSASRRRRAIETKRQQEQIKLAHLVPGGKRIVATQSDHMIPTGEPGLVVRTIRAVLARLAAGTRRS